jgi:hypothetical protein
MGASEYRPEVKKSKATWSVKMATIYPINYVYMFVC